MKNYEKQLDRLLFLICEDKSASPIYLGDLMEGKKINADGFEILLLAKKLVVDGYANAVMVEIKKPNHPDSIERKIDQDYYSSCLNGIIFLENGGYQAKKRKEKRQQIWTVVKIVAGVLNAIAIIAIGIVTVYFQFFTR